MLLPSVPRGLKEVVRAHEAKPKEAMERELRIAMVEVECQTDHLGEVTRIDVECGIHGVSDREPRHSPNGNILQCPASYRVYGGIWAKCIVYGSVE